MLVAFLLKSTRGITDIQKSTQYMALIINVNVYKTYDKALKQLEIYQIYKRIFEKLPTRLLMKYRKFTKKQVKEKQES